MRLLKIILFMLFITYVSSLDKLFSITKQGNYFRILNKNGDITKNYKGGIFIARGDGTFEPVHKKTQRGYVRR